MRATQQEWADAAIVACPRCRQPSGSRCVVLGGGRQPATSPHKRRVELALAVRAQAEAECRL
jgi:hypothetical protein